MTISNRRAYPPFAAYMHGSSMSRSPKAEFNRIRDAREWAESYGTTADSCTLDGANGVAVGRHMRDRNGDGTRWFRAA